MTAVQEHDARLREMAELSGWQPKPGSALEKAIIGKENQSGAGEGAGEQSRAGEKASGAVDGGKVGSIRASKSPRPPGSNGDVTDPYDNHKGPPHTRLNRLASASAATSRTPTSATTKPKRSTPAIIKKPSSAPSPSPPEQEGIPFMEPGPSDPPPDFWGVAGGARPAAPKGKKRQHGEATRALQSLSDMRNSVSGGLAEGLGMMSDDIICGDTDEDSGPEGGRYETVAAKARRMKEGAKERLRKSREKKAAGAVNSPAPVASTSDKGKTKAAPPGSTMLKTCDICAEQVQATFFDSHFASCAAALDAPPSDGELEVIQAPPAANARPPSAKPPPPQPPPPQPALDKTPSIANFFRPAGSSASSRPPSAAANRPPPVPSRAPSAASTTKPKPAPVDSLADELFPEDEEEPPPPPPKPKPRPAAPAPTKTKGKSRGRVIEDDEEDDDGDAGDLEFGGGDDDEQGYWFDGDADTSGQPQLLNTVIDVFSDDDDDDGDIIFNRPATQRPPGRSTAAGGAGLVNRDHEPGPMRGSPAPKGSLFVSTMQPSMRRGFEALFATREVRGRGGGSDDEGEVQKMTIKTAKPRKGGGGRGRWGWKKRGRGRR